MSKHPNYLIQILVKLFGLALLFLGLSLNTLAQETWTMRSCVEYGLEHNNNLRSADVNTRLADLQLKQSKLSQYPSANLNLSEGRSTGRSIDPTTNQFVNSGYWFTSISMNSNLLVFGWFQKKHEIEANNLNAMASKYNYESIQDDISLNIANAYLRALLAYKQIDIAEQQVLYSIEQAARTSKMVDAGVLPEINNLQVSSQLALDSSTYIQAVSTFNQMILQLKALMNLDFETELIPSDPQIERLKINNVLPTDDELISKSLDHRNIIKYNEANLKVSEENYLSARAQRYPQLSLGFNFGTNYTSIAQQLAGVDSLGVVPSQYFILQNQNIEQVYTYGFSPIYESTPFWTQVGNNSRFSLSLTLSVPLFSGYSITGAMHRARLNLESQEIAYQQSKLQLTQDVLKAKSDAINAYQVWKSSSSALSSAQKSFDFAQKRYEVGLMNLLEFQQEKNNLYKAHIQEISNFYEYIFNNKVLDFYIGNPIW